MRTRKLPGLKTGTQHSPEVQDPAVQGGCEKGETGEGDVGMW